MPYHTRGRMAMAALRSANVRIYGHTAVATRLDDASGFEAILGSAVEHRPLPRDRTAAPLGQPVEIHFVRALVFGACQSRSAHGERIWEPTRQRPPPRWWNEVPTLERLATLGISASS